MSKEPKLEVRDLSLVFKDKVLIRNFSLTMRQGEFVSISGKSGCGKTTLLKCLMGFAYPDQGAIFIEGQELNDKTVWPLRQKIGYVPQEPDLGSQRVEEFLQFPFQFKANRKLNWDEARVRDLFDSFHLDTELLGEKTLLLSGGEKQRIALISALLMKRDIYLLDEITSALDDETKKIIAHYLRERKDLTLLFVTHDSTIKAISHNVFPLKKGMEMRAGS